MSNDASNAPDPVSEVASGGAPGGKALGAGEAPSSAWWRLRCAVDADPVALDRALGLLWSLGTAGIEEREAPDGVELLAAFGGRAAASAALDAAVAAGAREARLEPVAADEGLDEWRAWAQPERAGRFWVVPAWLAPPPDAAADDVLLIEPGLTFGSGSHPTTRLVLALVDELAQPGATVLDVGAGSGVLAIGAARRGADATATDIDPEASPVTLANAERNEVAARVEVTDKPLRALAQEGRRFDLVVANLLAPVIDELGTDLVSCTAPGGHLVLSGLLADRWERSLEAVAPMVTVQTTELDGWVAVVLHHPGKGEPQG